MATVWSYRVSAAARMVSLLSIYRLLSVIMEWDDHVVDNLTDVANVLKRPVMRNVTWGLHCCVSVLRSYQPPFLTVVGGRDGDSYAILFDFASQFFYTPSHKYSIYSHFLVFLFTNFLCNL